MFILSTRRGQRQFQSSFVDAFQTQPTRTTFGRRAKSEYCCAPWKFEQPESISDILQASQDLISEKSGQIKLKINRRHTASEYIGLTTCQLSQRFPSSQWTVVAPEQYTSDKESQPTVSISSTSDAEASTKISPDVCLNLVLQESKGAGKISEEIQQLLSTLNPKSAAQKEWEQLWYHGIESSYQKVAPYFPEAEFLPHNSVPDQSISEPVLNISGLKKEDRKLFEQEEKSRKQTLIPRTEAERLARLQGAETATSVHERIALLLGLPTYKQYVASKAVIQQEPREESSEPSKRQQKRQAKFAEKKQQKADRLVEHLNNSTGDIADGQIRDISDSVVNHQNIAKTTRIQNKAQSRFAGGMSHQQGQDPSQIPIGGAEHRPLVVGLTKPPSIRSSSTMATSSDAAALNKEIAENVKENTASAAPTEANPTALAASKPKKEKAPKQLKPPKAAPVTAPTAPALIDLRVGHILRAIAHPNADSLYVSTIAMGDEEGTEHTQVDAETGKVVRTVCSGLNGLIPLEEMQDRKIIVVANLKPVNMRSIKSAAMVLAASPKQPEGADPHAADRVVELVLPPEGAEAGDKVYFEGWPYGEGKGPERQLNPKKKQWEAIQPGFFTGDDLVVGFDASQCAEVEGDAKGNLVVEGKGVCTVKTLKGAVVR